MKTNGKPPRLRQLRLLREIFLMTQPPLLAVMQGGEFDSRFASTTYLRTKREVENIDAIAIDQESVQGE